MIMLVLAVLSATAMDALIKLAGEDIGTWQLLFMRWLVGMLILLPVVIYVYKRGVIIKDKRIYYIRFLLNLIGCYALFYSLANIPFATVITILFAEPLFIIPLAVILLGETLSLKNVVASVIGFSAVFYINQPTKAGMGLDFFAPVIAALMLALEHVLNKKMGSEENPQLMLFWLAAPLALVSLPMTTLHVGWESVTAFQWWIVGAAAIFGNAYNYFIIVGFRYTKVSTGGVLLYLAVPLSFVIGAIAFEEIPSVSDIVCGVAILVASMLANVSFKRKSRQQKQ
ncbi:hypothetical protein ATN88_17050 [Enterovibrio coralii]|uniref:EamA domain-containing protein n=2 Tax=Enterovibrio coralii TaxID=294935 RepID=A0A135IDN3_9GAMM|nr:hypothetical protein ATN88_17050 [Enterovibrio coralii]